MPNEKLMSGNQSTRLKNVRCAYCNAEFFGSNEPQKEHVVGRKFVPQGMHYQGWNLHINACHRCNQKKSDLEDDISAITMIDGLPESDLDQLKQKEAIRKSRTTSRRTGKSVAESKEEFEVAFNLYNASIRMQMVGKPQFDEERAFELAWFQIAGFFFFLS